MCLAELWRCVSWLLQASQTPWRSAQTWVSQSTAHRHPLSEGPELLLLQGTSLNLIAHPRVPQGGSRGWRNLLAAGPGAAELSGSAFRVRDGGAGSRPGSRKQQQLWDLGTSVALPGLRVLTYKRGIAG